MILPIYTYGQPVLREKAEPVDESYPDLKQLIDSMFETMYHAEGVGLAAPQVGHAIRLLVIDADAIGDDYVECKNFKRVMINPEIIEKSEETIALEEGCLSFPGIHEKVTRAAKVRVKYRDEHGAPRDETFEGFAARVVQHECEHLDGQVFIDSISPIRKQLNKSKLNAIVKGSASCSYRVKALKK
ncbi:MAG: peptide deformylase [Tannerella sp.]|jgi:peptide deformylase|nr:peptide deformylase [Tannerella sp.]